FTVAIRVELRHAGMVNEVLAAVRKIESPIAIAQEHVDPGGEAAQAGADGIDNSNIGDEIQVAVAVEIAGNQRQIGAQVSGHVGWRLEAAIAVAEEDGHFVFTWERHGQVELAIVIEVAGNDRAHIALGTWEAHRNPERAVAITQEHNHRSENAA